MQKLTIVSNLEEADAKMEDAELMRLLSVYFSMELADISDNFIPEDRFFLIRNIWGKPRSLMLSVYEKFKSSCYLNPLTGKGDQKGKKYLVDLYNQGYPVIPTFRELEKVPKNLSNNFLLKPLYGASSKGIKRVTREELLKERSLDVYIIQPYVDFLYESSFFYIDNQFQYSFKTNSSRWDLILYTPEQSELEIANEFVNWNPIQGIQRIDFLHDRQGKQFLLEIEDWCPYLSLCDIEDIPKDKFVYNLSESIKNLQL